MEIRFLGVHNLESASTKLTSILVDGVLALDAGGLTSSLSLDEQAKIQSILLTHGHYDHIRDIPAFALANSNRTTDILGTEPTLEILSTHLINGTVYPKFTERPSPDEPVLRPRQLKPYQTTIIGQYSILPVPVPHSSSAVGYQIMKAGSPSPGGMFFTGDTGPGLSECWRYISSELIVVDITFSDEWSDTAREHGHLCPSLFGKELEDFRRVKGYLPRVIFSHMTPQMERDIEREASQLAKEMGCEIDIAYEGMAVAIS